jgi:hypothetical protein
MKEILTLCCLLLITQLGFAQSEKPSKGALIEWVESTHDFGDIAQGEKVEHTFRFINKGTLPLLITNVEVTCGCTTPKGWPRDPIEPGETGEIAVAFNSSGKIGIQRKVVTIISNSMGVKNQVVFTANVVERK